VSQIDLGDIDTLARRAIHKAAIDWNIYLMNTWGPGHELAHALVSTTVERRKYLYGLDDVTTASTKARIKYALCFEAAAMHVSFKIHTACGRLDLVQEELDDTDEEAAWMLDTPTVATLLRARRCHRIPRTLVGLERLCSRRGLIR